MKKPLPKPNQLWHKGQGRKIICVRRKSRGTKTFLVPAKPVENHETQPNHEQIASANDRSEVGPLERNLNRLSPYARARSLFRTALPVYDGEITVSKMRGNQFNVDSKSVSVPGIFSPLRATPNLMKSDVIWSSSMFPAISRRIKARTCDVAHFSFFFCAVGSSFCRESDNKNRKICDRVFVFSSEICIYH